MDLQLNPTWLLVGYAIGSILGLALFQIYLAIKDRRRR